MRVRQFTQDDAHIFCREDQIIDEVQDFCALADRIYKDFGFSYAIKLALRPDQRFGSDAVWDLAEAELRDAVVRAGLATADYGWAALTGDGAFYARNLAWHLTDAPRRHCTVGTIHSAHLAPQGPHHNYHDHDLARPRRPN